MLLFVYASLPTNCPRITCCNSPEPNCEVELISRNCLHRRKLFCLLMFRLQSPRSHLHYEIRRSRLAYSSSFSSPTSHCQKLVLPFSSSLRFWTQWPKLYAPTSQYLPRISTQWPSDPAGCRTVTQLYSSCLQFFQDSGPHSPTPGCEKSTESGESWEEHPL